MREIKAVNITPGDFAPFGTYYSMTEPEGYPLQGEIHKGGYGLSGDIHPKGHYASYALAVSPSPIRQDGVARPA